MGGFSPTVALSEEDTAQLLPNNHYCRSSGNSRPCELSPGEVPVLLTTTGTAEKRVRKAGFVQHKPKPEKSNDAKTTPSVATRHVVHVALSPSHLEEDFLMQWAQVSRWQMLQLLITQSTRKFQRSYFCAHEWLSKQSPCSCIEALAKAATAWSPCSLAFSQRCAIANVSVLKQLFSQISQFPSKWNLADYSG